MLQTITLLVPFLLSSFTYSSTHAAAPAGYGTRLPAEQAQLQQALRELLPADWTVEYAPSIDPHTPVTYRKGGNFRDSLYSVTGGEGFRFFILSHQNTLWVFGRLDETDDF